MKSLSILCMTTTLTAGLSLISPDVRADERAPAALTGQVTSDAEGAMEGVVVTARKDGSIVSTSVTTMPKAATLFRKTGWNRVIILSPFARSATILTLRRTPTSSPSERAHSISSSIKRAISRASSAMPNG